MKNSKISKITFVLALFFIFAVFTQADAQEFNIMLNSRECLDLEDASQRNSVRLITAPCDNSSPTQKFQIVQKPGTNFINIKISRTRCIEISAAQPDNGIKVTQFDCDNSNEQAFELINGAIPTGSSSITGPIRFTHSGKCFDASNRPWIEQFVCNGSRNQIFEIAGIPQIAINNPQATDSMVLNNSAFDVRQKLPLKVGQVELTDISTFCPNGCQNFSRDSFLTLEGWTPNLSAGNQRDSQAQAIKPALLLDYCVSDAAQKGMNLLVKIFDRNKNTAFANNFSYVITPSDCPTSITPNPPNNPAANAEDILWDSIKNSKDIRDFQNYLNRFGQNGKYAPLARLIMPKLSPAPTPQPPSGNSTVEDQYWDLIKNSNDPKDFQNYLRDFPNGKYATLASLRTPSTPTNTGGTNLSVEDEFWNRIKNSRNKNDFQSYLQNFPNGKYAPLARLELGTGSGGNPNPQPPLNNLSSEDIFWKSIETSTNRKDFENYLTQFGQNGKYASLARLKIANTPTSEQLDDQHWNRIRNSNDAFDFQGYLNTFPNGKNVRNAQMQIIKIRQDEAKVDFLRNAQFGSLSEISNKRRVFITTDDLNSRNRIVEKLQKDVPSLVIVGSRQSAEFFIEYKLVISSACDPGNSTAANACELHTGEMWVHTKGLVGTGNEFNRILWSTTKTKSYSSAGMNLFDKNPAAQAAGDLTDSLKNIGF